MDDDKKKLEQITNQIIYGGLPGVITFIDNGNPTVAVRTDVTDSTHFITLLVAMIKSLAQCAGMKPVEVAKTIVAAFEFFNAKDDSKEND